MMKLILVYSSIVFKLNIVQQPFIWHNGNTAEGWILMQTTIILN